MGRSKMPDRWLNYNPMNEIFYNERIIPIKVPLPLNRFLDPAMQEFRWTPADVMYRLPNLGMIIDTTYKSPPYYNTYEFTSQGIEYVKIMCAGHHVPSEEVYQRFCEAVRRFLFDRRNDGKIIALHCTHGINRTGYLLCRYLIEDHRYSAEEALYAFSTKRGYPVERENYIEELKKVSAMRRY